MDSSESIPFSAFDCTGTPRTGTRVFAAAIPGRWAAPSPCNDDLQAACNGGLRILKQQVGGAVCRNNRHFVSHAKRVEHGTCVLHGFPVGPGTHDDSNFDTHLPNFTQNLVNTPENLATYGFLILLTECDIELGEQ